MADIPGDNTTTALALFSSWNLGLQWLATGSSSIDFVGDIDRWRLSFPELGTFTFFAHFANAETSPDLRADLFTETGTSPAAGNDDADAGSLFYDPLFTYVVGNDLPTFLQIRVSTSANPAAQVGDYEFVVLQDAGPVILGTLGIDNATVNAPTNEKTYLAGGGNDIITLGTGFLNLLGDAGSDRLTGNTSDNHIFGGLGDDFLFGMDGSDRLLGGRGNDWLDGGDGNDFLDGGLGDDWLFGGTGTNGLDGGAGADHMFGGTASGTQNNFVVDNLDDYVDGSLNPFVLNTLFSTVNVDLTDASRFNGFFQTIYLDGTATTVIGNGVAQYIGGNNLNNVLDGGANIDTLEGLLGNDTYVLGAESDTVIDSGGIDTITSTAPRSLLNYASIENLTLLGLHIAGTGNNLNNVIIGSAGNNPLSGGIGNDWLYGMGNVDRLDGGVGNDTMNGGLGNDVFVWNAPVSIANRDVISDFSNVTGNNDTFHLNDQFMPQLGAGGTRALNPAFFKVIGTAALDANDYIQYNRSAGYLYFDSNGSGAGGSTIIAILTNKPVLTVGDFVVL